MRGVPSRPEADHDERRARRRRRRRRWIAAALAAVLLATPLPWRHVVSDSPPGSAWRLDGKLVVEGRVMDPPGRWTWLAVGRPQLLGERLWELMLPGDDTSTDLRAGPAVRSPALAEPAAAAVGLARAGLDVPLRLIVEVGEPTELGLPASGMVVGVGNGGMPTREAWQRYLDEPAGSSLGADLRLADGTRVPLTGGMPYARVLLAEIPAEPLEAHISFGLPEWGPVAWLRDLSLGSSHGLMVALVTYTEASGRDLAQGRHIAGTGRLRGDGQVIRIGGLPAKAAAAHRAGADVLLFPESQTWELDAEDFPGMTLVGVSSLDEAIAWLEQLST